MISNQHGGNDFIQILSSSDTEFVSDEEYSVTSVTLNSSNQPVDEDDRDHDDDLVSDEVFETIEPGGFDDHERINTNRRDIVAFEVVTLLEDVSKHFCRINKLLKRFLLFFSLKSETIQIDVYIVFHESLNQRHIFRSFWMEPHEDDGNWTVKSDDEFVEETTRVSKIVMY